MVVIIGSIFQDKNKEGDFNWMIQQPEYDKVLFIFNDDIESINKYQRGMGNAIIRPYNKNNPQILIPRSAGIPTGSRKNKSGFTSLDNITKTHIDNSIEEITKLIRKYQYETIIYSINESGKLGTGIFTVDNSVIDYITEEIQKLSEI